jgi:hypothetical protein
MGNSTDSLDLDLRTALSIRNHTGAFRLSGSGAVDARYG